MEQGKKKEDRGVALVTCLVLVGAASDPSWIEAREEGTRRRGHRAPDRCEEGRPWRKKVARRRGHLLEEKEEAGRGGGPGGRRRADWPREKTRPSAPARALGREGVAAAAQRLGEGWIGKEAGWVDVEIEEDFWRGWRRRVRDWMDGTALLNFRVGQYISHGD